MTPLRTRGGSTLSTTASESGGFTIAVMASADPRLRALVLGCPPEVSADDIEQLARPAVVLARPPCESLLEAVARENEVACLVVAEPGMRGLHDPRIDDVVFSSATPEEVLLRADRALARKRGGDPSLEGLRLSDEGFEWRSRHVPLSAAELRLFARLLRARGATLSRWELTDALGTAGLDATSRALDAHIYRIRRKLRDLPELQLETVRQRGVRLRIGGPSPGRSGQG